MQRGFCLGLLSLPLGFMFCKTGTLNLSGGSQCFLVLASEIVGLLNDFFFFFNESLSSYEISMCHIGLLWLHPGSDFSEQEGNPSTCGHQFLMKEESQSEQTADTRPHQGGDRLSGRCQVAALGSDWLANHRVGHAWLLSWGREQWGWKVNEAGRRPEV